MVHFAKYQAHLSGQPSASISNTIQSVPVGKKFQFGLIDGAGLNVGPNDARYGAAKPHRITAGAKNVAFDLIALRAGNVMVEARDPKTNKVVDSFQLAVTSNPAFYFYCGHFDMRKFEAGLSGEFASDPRFDAGKVVSARTLLTLMQSDPLIVDIRWMAYMLATAFWETTSPRFRDVPVLNKKTHKPIMGADGRPRTKKIIVSWQMTMEPVDEYLFGIGRDYHMPVKVMKQPDGSARITENDGDQFSVSVEGKAVAITKHAAMGAPDGAKSAKVYLVDSGTPRTYHGRGYVQLTWWVHYAAAGVALGRGLDLLFDPELVKQPAVAYALMSHGMRTGYGFANGRRFVNYFSGNTTNYVGARAMVNGHDHAKEIAGYAEKFQTILIGSKL